MDNIVRRYWRRISGLALWFGLPAISRAQPGINEFYRASGEMHRWYFSLSDLVLVIGAIAGILGGLRIYANWQSGKHHHIDAQVMGWFFSCLFLTLVGAFLKALYGIS
ncbi:DUF4134 family protein [Elizabethkingia anophelis]|uniref:DUF4134 family protein n=1 Tax=Elizabethkingia anophelis TaxID=1117645 RepID=UPI0012B21670|nr:DUF4134 family protein [Elizabethkingia anophelis]QGN22531.1 DUF4134 domain-containing protein [Elizabethkingia anophelis]QNV09183.1 DUF4134 domain-containing protein [Elizabethkingia anophelis]UTF90939.1 DUF4134 family protein [Elizabethkingia anophelis]UTG01809.1 DUF4134 family protein [Elizabethkingia anophelis]UTG05559.1 DUF4134 family protein [Elizabethkingia anophelis]